MNTSIEHYRNKLACETDAWDLRESLLGDGKVVVVDARSKGAFEQEHIPHSINLPHRTINQDSTTHLERSKLYVTYCDGIGCNASTKAALKLAELGFQVKELIGGLEWWKRDGYPTESNLVAVH